MRTRRVGSLTCGVLMILFGALFLIHMLVPTLTFTLIFKLWPLILVFLGIEIILSNVTKKEEQLKYDGGAIALTIILAMFSMGMGLMEFCMNNVSYYWGW